MVLCTPLFSLQFCAKRCTVFAGMCELALFLYLGSFLVMGCEGGLVGPMVSALARNVDVSVSTLTVCFIARSINFFLGSIAGVCVAFVIACVVCV